MTNIRYENYPAWIILVSNLVSLGIYAIGAFVILRIGLHWMGLYLFYILFLEIRLLQKSCAHCCYYGKVCAFGRGIICSLFFAQSDAKVFCQMTWKDMIPDFLVSIIPLITGIILLMIRFDLLLLLLLALLAALTTFGNGFVRSKLACKYCKQLDLGCPAQQLFSKEKK